MSRQAAQLSFFLVVFSILQLTLPSIFLAAYGGGKSDDLEIKSLRVVMDNNYPPYVFLNGDGDVQGLLIDLWQLWQQKTGRKVEIVATDWAEAQKRMKNGEFDVIDTMFLTPERQGWLTFGAPYRRIEVPAFFRKNISGITDIKSLRSFNVAVKEGDAAVEVLRRNGVQNLTFYKGYEDIIRAAKEQMVNVFVVDKPPALHFLYKYGIEHKFHQTPPIASGDFHRAVAKGNQQLLALVEAGFAKISPEELEELEKKWFGEPIKEVLFTRYILFAALATCLLLLLLFFWNRSLTEAVRRRTSELSASREQLLASDALYRSILDTINDAFFRTDQKGNLLFVSPSGARLLGYETIGEMLGKPLATFWPRDEKRLNMKKALDETGVISDFEAVLIRKDGSTVDILASVGCYYDQHGNFLGFQGICRDIGKRKRAEAELYKTKELLAQTSRMARVGGWEKYPHSGENHWTEMTREIMEVDDDFIPTMESSLTFYEEGLHRDIIAKAFDNAIKNGVPFDVEVQIVTAKGNKRWTRIIGRSEFKADVCVRLYGTIQDIDLRKKTENALIESEGRLQFLVKHSSDSLVILNAEGSQRYVSPAAERITGFPVSELEGRSIESIIHPEDLPAVTAAWEDAVAHPEKTVTVQYRHIHKTNRWVYSEAIAQSFLDVPAIRGVVASVRDITAHKRIEEELQRSQRQLRLFLDASPDMYFLKDRDLRYLLVNQEATKFFNLPESEILGKTDNELMAADSARICAVTDRQVLAGQQKLLVVEEIAGRLYEMQKLPVLLEEEVGGVAGIIRDITDRQKSEEDKQRLQMQLTQAQKMESVGRLAGGVAHDFNNMLSVILGHAELALGQVERTQQLFTHLTEISKAAKRSSDLTRQLLAFARKQTVAPKVLNINTIVEGMLTMLRRLIGEDIALEWHPGQELANVKIDPSQVDQMLANLCVNARDAIVDTGKITIVTQAVSINEEYCLDHPDHQPGDFVKLIITDTGTGMSQDILSHLFEPFFTTKDMGKGTGLGLATVYGIVTQNHGFITVQSTEGVGTQFSIFLPVHRLRDDLERSGVDSRDTTFGRETLLLVEDEPMILEVTKTMLTVLGYSVLSALTPGQAIQLANEHSEAISLLITDVIMPDMNGRELAKTLQKLIPDMKLLFMSGYTADIIAQHGVLSEGTHFIQKPFSMEELGAKVREVIDQHERSSSQL